MRIKFYGCSAAFLALVSCASHGAMAQIRRSAMNPRRNVIVQVTRSSGSISERARIT